MPYMYKDSKTNNRQPFANNAEFAKESENRKSMQGLPL